MYFYEEMEGAYCLTLFFFDKKLTISIRKITIFHITYSNELRCNNLFQNIKI